MAEAAQLRDRVQDGATPADREAGLNGIVQFVDAVGRPAEPFVVPLLPAVLKALSDKVCARCRAMRRLPLSSFSRAGNGIGSLGRCFVF